MALKLCTISDACNVANIAEVAAKLQLPSVWTDTNGVLGIYSLQRVEDIYSNFGLIFIMGDTSFKNQLNMSDHTDPLVFNFYLQSLRDTGGTLRLHSRILLNEVNHDCYILRTVLSL